MDLPALVGLYVDLPVFVYITSDVFRSHPPRPDSRLGTADAEIMVSSVENPELSYILSFKAWSRLECVAVYVSDINQPSLSTPFYSVLVSVSVFMAFSTVFHSVNPPNSSSLSHSVLPVLFLPD